MTWIVMIRLRNFIFFYVEIFIITFGKQKMYKSKCIKISFLTFSLNVWDKENNSGYFKECIKIWKILFEMLHCLDIELNILNFFNSSDVFIQKFNISVYLSEVKQTWNLISSSRISLNVTLRSFNIQSNDTWLLKFYQNPLKYFSFFNFNDF